MDSLKANFFEKLPLKKRREENKNISELEKLVISVLKDFLKREPTIEDAKLCDKIFYTNERINFTLSYNGERVGFFYLETNIDSSKNWKFNI